MNVGSIVLQSRLAELEALSRAVLEEIEADINRELAKYDTPGAEPSSIDPEANARLARAFEQLDQARWRLEEGVMWGARAARLGGQ